MSSKMHGEEVRHAMEGYKTYGPEDKDDIGLV